MTTTYTARWVFTAVGPPIPHGTVMVKDDRIVAVNETKRADVDLGDVAILPGLVNAHTHLDLTGAAGKIPPTTADRFTEWLVGVIAFRKTQSTEDIEASIQQGLKQLRETSTTAVGDIAVKGGSWDALSASDIRARVYWELIGLDEKKLNEAYPKDHIGKTQSATYQWGISPHAPYTVHAKSANMMFAVGSPSATHIAETEQERKLLEERTGPFVPFLQKAGVYNSESLANSWQDFLQLALPITQPRRRIIVHGNYLPSDFPFHKDDVVCYCPRTHAAFGHKPHPYRAFLQRGIPVCLGTDSLASNPDLDIFAEACFLKKLNPDLPGETLLQMITLNGAKGLGFQNECGSIEAGKSADFTILPWRYPDDNPNEQLFQSVPRYFERKTLFRGQWRNG